ncbi:hypothetical protein OUZ56_012673 [Daphnia magna]|uniref:Uncharacterized protein n=1 Tax=Daphnia magna TaxID=35525 RepID=A0ABQ9Z3R2_9CRUS|nr:hypothetical protein OUZ56_012673 [Daphnia magna]
MKTWEKEKNRIRPGKIGSLPSTAPSGPMLLLSPPSDGGGCIPSIILMINSCLVGSLTCSGLIGIPPNSTSWYFLPVLSLQGSKDEEKTSNTVDIFIILPSQLNRDGLDDSSQFISISASSQLNSDENQRNCAKCSNAESRIMILESDLSFFHTKNQSLLDELILSDARQAKLQDLINFMKSPVLSLNLEWVSRNLLKLMLVAQLTLTV